ncbi:hypothetical protein Poli38472_013383 [Pythium oligandrum]|uniref:BZIP domain-containing protein n=1 Tax=Pythium oligandrum TaxID=41045 RepID=A0A8K1C791_PYTOL|nr:hypothetical protein Poli38472_013383 [Pythium oligandrum]|eukprot:TMW57909.1 hypothetical protein Poli38472_013383 [Pythium oligandrum]
MNERTPEKALPALEAVTSPLNPDEKAARQREHARRTYYRKLNQMQALRGQMHKLEDQYERLMEIKRQKEELDTVSGLSYLVGTRMDLSELYADITDVKERLLKQNEALQAASRDDHEFALKAQKWLTDADDHDSLVLYSSSSSSDEA